MVALNDLERRLITTCMAYRWNQKVNSMKMGGATNARSVQWKSNFRNPLLEMAMPTWLNFLSLCEVCAPILFVLAVAFIG